MKRENLLKNKGYLIAKIQNELFRQLTEYLENNNMTQTQLAQQLGVTKGYISQILNGNFDYKLSKLVELSLAIGKVPELKYIPFDEIERRQIASVKVIDFSERRFSNHSPKASILGIEYKENKLPEYKYAN